MSNSLCIDRLFSGGAIVNYVCSSACKHCLYRSAPNRERDYIDQDSARANLRKLRETGCSSIHVGGGEPFLNIDGLLDFARIAQEEHVFIEYIETNSSWYKSPEQAKPILRSLQAAGVHTLLLSISPFHTEYIPLKKVKGLMQTCKSVNMDVFPWQTQFYDELNKLGDDTTHSFAEMMEEYGEQYFTSLPRRYPLTQGGRTISTYAHLQPQQKWEDIIANSTTRCNELASTNHFHMDLFGNYIPGLCTGLAIHRDDLGKELTTDEYPVLITLYNDGIKGLYEFAVEKYDFKPAETYASRCHMCNQIRQHIFENCGKNRPKGMEPAGYYKVK